MKLQINVPVSGLDLANLLQGEEGFFLCQNRGQNFIAVAKAGHSIAFGPTPIGRGIMEQPSATLGPEPWVVTKIRTRLSLLNSMGRCPAQRCARARQQNAKKTIGSFGGETTGAFDFWPTRCPQACSARRGE